jgi:hypothetical protein
MSVDPVDPRSWPAGTLVLRRQRARHPRPRRAIVARRVLVRVHRPWRGVLGPGAIVPQQSDPADECGGHSRRGRDASPLTRTSASPRPIWLDPATVRCHPRSTGAQSGAEGRSVDAGMITLQADFNHLDTQGRLRLGDLHMHQRTPFAELAARQEGIIFLDGEDVVRGGLVHDVELGWVGQVDWATQDSWESYPPVLAARG